MKKRRITFIFSALILHNICQATPIKQALNTTSKHSNDLPIPFLGGGYSDDLQTPLGVSCLADSKTQFIGDSKTVISLGKSYSWDDIQKSLNVDVSSSLSIGMFSADANAQYAKYAQESNYSESFYYLEKVILPTETLVPAGFGQDGLNSFGKMAYAAGPDQFRLACGDQFYQEQTLGANLYATFKITFNSANDKTNFNAHLGGKIGSFFTASADIQQIVQDNHIQGNLEISALQDGGDSKQLANLFKKCGEHYCVTTCSLDDLGACQSIIDDIIEYAQNNFPNQIDFQKGKVIAGVSLGFNPSFYSQRGLNIGSSIVTPEIIAARQYLGDLYKKTRDNSDLVDHILSSQIASSILKEEKEKLLTLRTALHDNLSLLASSNTGAIGCYIDPKKCVQLKSEIDKELEAYDVSVLNIFKAGFIDRGVDGPYFIVPIGGNQFLSFNQDGKRFTSQETIQLSTDGKILHVEGMNIGNISFTGNLTNSGDNVWTGILHYSTGHEDMHQFLYVGNPI